MHRLAQRQNILSACTELRLQYRLFRRRQHLRTTTLRSPSRLLRQPQQTPRHHRIRRQRPTQTRGIAQLQLLQATASNPRLPAAVR